MFYLDELLLKMVLAGKAGEQRVVLFGNGSSPRDFATLSCTQNIQ
jgi:hypothetical protein